MRAVDRRRRLEWPARCLLAVLATVGPAAWPTAALAAPVAQIAAGDHHTCLLRSAAVSCWGADGQGQLGDGGSTDRPDLTAVHLGGVRVASLAAGGDRTCAASTAGTVYCWGAGYGAAPVTVDTAGVPVAALAVGASVACALSTGGALSCWDSGGQPVAEDVAGQPVTRVAAGGSGVCAVTATGEVYCWSGGQPALVDLGGPSATQVDVGADHACALSSGGTAYCWSDAQPVAVAVPGGIRFANLAAGTAQDCAVATTGRAYCWTGSGVPVAVHAPAAARFTQVDAGATGACGLTRSGTAYCWGGDLRAAAVRTPPAPPTRVTGTGGDGYLDVSWAAPASWGSGRPGGYLATAQPGGGNCRSARATHCRIGGLPNGTAYTLTVVATATDGGSGASAPSAPVSPRVLPQVPSDVRADPGDAALSVSWSVPVSLGSGKLKGFGAVASPGGATCTTPMGTGCTITGLANGTTYTVQVYAVTTAGSSVPGVPSNPATPGAPVLPATVPAGDGDVGSSAGAAFTTARTTTLTGGGFAPDTPVLVGLYPGARVLAAAESDGSGNLTADVTLPGDVRGGYHLVVRGQSPGGATRTLVMPVSLSAAAPAGGQLVTVAAAIGVLLFAGGLVLLVLAIRGGPSWGGSGRSPGSPGRAPAPRAG